MEVQRFPYPRLYYGSERHAMNLPALRFAVIFFIPFCMLVMRLVREKHSGVKVAVSPKRYT